MPRALALFWNKTASVFAFIHFLILLYIVVRMELFTEADGSSLRKVENHQRMYGTLHPAIPGECKVSPLWDPTYYWLKRGCMSTFNDTENHLG